MFNRNEKDRPMFKFLKTVVDEYVDECQFEFNRQATESVSRCDSLDAENEMYLRENGILDNDAFDREIAALDELLK